MKIAVNTRFLLKDRLEGIGVYSDEILKRMVLDNPNHEYHFLFDRPFHPSFLYGDNVFPHRVSPPARHPILWKWWFDISVKRWLKKISPDVFFSPDGFLSTTSTIPTVLTIHDIAFEVFPKAYKRIHAIYYKYYTPRFVHRAQKVITVSNHTKNHLIEKYGICTKKIEVIYNGVDHKFLPIHTSERQKVRNDLTQGKPFFLYVGAIHPRKNLGMLISAFEAFKETDEQGFTLVIVGRYAWKSKFEKQLIKKSSVSGQIIHLQNVKSSIEKIVGAATLLCYLSKFEGFGLPIIEAMKSGVPVLCSDVSSMPETAGGAAHLVNPDDKNAIVASMKKITSDNAYRNALIEKGKKRANDFSWKVAAKQTFEILQQTGSQTIRGK